MPATPELLPLLLGCDLLIGAVDSATVRQYLNLLAVCALIPYLDAGVGIRAEAGRIQQGGGQVQARAARRDRLPDLHRASGAPERGGTVDTLSSGRCPFNAATFRAR
jgi:hypothetical protein